MVGQACAKANFPAKQSLIFKKNLTFGHLDTNIRVRMPDIKMHEADDQTLFKLIPRIRQGLVRMLDPLIVFS